MLLLFQMAAKNFVRDKVCKTSEALRQKYKSDSSNVDTKVRELVVFEITNTRMIRAMKYNEIYFSTNALDEMFKK